MEYKTQTTYDARPLQSRAYPRRSQALPPRRRPLARKPRRIPGRWIPRGGLPKHLLPFAVLAAVIALFAAVLLPALLGQAAQATGSLLNADAPRSTPMSLWHAGEVPELYQTDPQWADESYAGSDIRTSGCGPTCLSMAYIALTGNHDLDPVEMGRYLEANGHTVDGMTAWTAMTEGARGIGLSSEELPASADAVRNAIEAGSVIICSMRPGDFTSTGHFIVLSGVNDDGTLQVRDPNSPERTHTSWDAERVISQAANIWALSR